jgi:hypothetical protein
MPGIDRIQRELEVIARLDEMFRQKKDPSPSDLLRCQARQSRRQELLEMLQEVGTTLSPVVAFARKKHPRAGRPEHRDRLGRTSIN